MWLWIIFGIAFYVIIGALVFFALVSNFPVTPGLALLRAILWPVYLLTGWPQGSPLPMD